MTGIPPDGSKIETQRAQWIHTRLRKHDDRKRLGGETGILAFS
jgi:hypothetical protein